MNGPLALKICCNTGDKENNDWASENFNENSIVEVDGQPAGGEGELLEQKKKSKQDHQAVGKSVVNGEEFGPGHVEFDSAEDPTIVTTDEVKDGLDAPEEDPTHFGMDVYFITGLKFLSTFKLVNRNRTDFTLKQLDLSKSNTIYFLSVLKEINL